MKYEWKSPEELSKWMKSNIKYDHSSNWKLRSPEEVINSKKGDCHDQSLLEYEVLKSLGYKTGRLFMVEYSSWNQPGGATHTACWYEKSNKYYWFENAWGGKEGIHGPYKSLDELKSAIADAWNWSGANDKLYMGNCSGVKVGMDLGEYVSTVVPEKESNKVFHKNDSVNEFYIYEGTKSVIDPNYKPKGKLNLSSFKRVHITDSVISKYKKEYPFLSHVRCKDTDTYICDGYIWFDDNKLVAMVGSCEYRDDHTKWVVSLEITKNYKGYGLSKQILDYATKSMKCKYLSVNKNNNVAKKVYDEYGFKVYQQDKTMYYMTIDSNISSQENCSFLNVQDCMAEIIDYTGVKTGMNLGVVYASTAMPEKEYKKGQLMDDIDMVNESLEARLTTNILKNQITIYHGSPDKMDTIMPMSFNAGTKLSKPRMSSFWADEYTAKLFAVYRLIESNGFKVSFSPDMNGLLVKPLDYNNIIVLLKYNPVYLYEKTLDKKYVGIGHSDYFDEYTVDLPVKPDSIYVLQYDQLKNVVENIDKYPTNDDDRIDTIIKDNLRKMTTMNSNILRKIIANDMQYFKSTAKEYKKGQLMNVNTESNSILESDGNISYNKSFDDIKKIVDTLSKSDLNRICNGTFKDSPYVIYREVLLLDKKPVSFIDVYKLPDMDEDGCIVIATDPKYRNIGLSSKLVAKMKHKLKGKNLVWKTQKDNITSIKMGNKMGYSPVLEEYTYYNGKKTKKVPKNVKLYHGSRIQNLKEIIPHNDSTSRIGNASAVYATKDKRFAACYGTLWNDDIAKQGSWDDWNTVVMGLSDKVDMDDPCSLYELENDGSFFEISSREVASLNTIKVIKEHKYSSYKEMLKKNGVKMISYDNYKSNVNNPNPVFDYLDESAVVNEDAAEFIVGVLLLSAMAPKLVSLDKASKEMKAKLKDSTKTEFYVSKEKDGKSVTTRYSEPEYAVLDYAYENGIHEGESKTIFVDDSTKKILDDKIYVYSKSKILTKMVKSGSFESVCKSYGIKIKEIDKSHIKERADAVKKALSELRSKMPSIIRSKGQFPASKNKKYVEEYTNFTNMVSNSLVIFYASLWNIDKEARTHAKEGLHYDTIWKPLEDCLAEVNKALPKGYKVDYDGGDWDDILIDIRATSVHESAILEEKRSEIPTKDFGVPSKRKFPLTDAKHVKSAIKFFNYVDEEDEAELARNIKRKAKDFGVVIRCSKRNRLSKYINKEYVNEFMAVSAIGNNMYAVNNGNIKQHIAQGDHIVSATDSYPYTKKEKRKKKDPVDGRISVYMGDGEKLTVNESAEKVPIYIIAYDYSSVFALALKATTHSHYNHIAIALSPDLEHAYTFARPNKGDHSVKGFTEEPLSQMIKEHGNFYIKVNAVYIPKSAYDKIKSMISDYKKHKDDTSYNYGNLVRGALGIKVDNDDLDSDNMNCSIFVDYMLKNVGVDITDNPNSNLVFPEHLANADMNHDNVVTVYYGNAKGYNKKKVSKMKFLGESIDDDTFFDNLEKQFEDLDMELIPTDIFNERKDQG